MRNPSRIKPVCELIERFWRSNPDLRLVQMFEKLSEIGHRHFGIDPWAIEEDRWREVLERYLHTQSESNRSLEPFTIDTDDLDRLLETARQTDNDYWDDQLSGMIRDDYIDKCERAEAWESLALVAQSTSPYSTESSTATLAKILEELNVQSQRILRSKQSRRDQEPASDDEKNGLVQILRNRNGLFFKDKEELVGFIRYLFGTGLIDETSANEEANRIIARAINSGLAWRTDDWCEVILDEFRDNLEEAANQDWSDCTDADKELADKICERIRRIISRIEHRYRRPSVG